MSETNLSGIIQGIIEGKVVPYIGSGTLKGSTNIESGEPIPSDSDSLIIAMNQGKPMAPKLMYEFPRAAMNIELKRGRSAVNNFLTDLYGKQRWTSTPLHDALSIIKPKYLVDINRDTLLQDAYAETRHNLIIGLSRISGTDYRFKTYEYDGDKYTEKPQEDIDPSLPILFKPMGSPIPEPNYIASDADYVDYITELMGGFAIPSFLKEHRIGKQYVFLGVRFNRDTERMVMSDIIYGADKPAAWALISDPTKKEVRYCKRMNIEIIPADVDDFVEALGAFQNVAVNNTSNQAAV